MKSESNQIQPPFTIGDISHLHCVCSCCDVIKDIKALIWRHCLVSLSNGDANARNGRTLGQNIRKRSSQLTTLHIGQSSFFKCRAKNLIENRPTGDQWITLVSTSLLYWGWLSKAEAQMQGNVDLWDYCVDLWLCKTTRQQGSELQQMWSQIWPT